MTFLCKQTPCWTRGSMNAMHLTRNSPDLKIIMRSANCIKSKGGESMGLNDIHSLSHSKWNCKYHIVFAPKYRRKILRQLCELKGVNIIEAEVYPEYIKHEYSAQFLFKRWKRVRKYGTYCTGIKQNADVPASISYSKNNDVQLRKL